MNEYNTTRPTLVLREYGRNIQKLVQYIVTIEDREERTAQAHALVNLIKQINYSVKDSVESLQRIWDDIFIMSGFNLDIDSPFPMPEKDILVRKPQRMSYHTHEIRYKHYGRNIELLIEKALALGEDEREEAVIQIGRLMNTFYLNWNKDSIDQEIIIRNIKELSGGQLSIDLAKVKENSLFGSSIRERSNSNKVGNKNKKSNNNKRKK